MDETSSARLPDVFLSSQDVCAQHSATMQKHFAMVEGNLYKVLESLVRFVEGGVGRGFRAVHVEDGRTMCVGEE